MSNLKTNLAEKFNPNRWSGWQVWKHYKYTGANLIDEVNALDPDLVIDVGCGHNRYKGHIKNLIGFDREPFPFADIISDIDDVNFRKESADVVLVLGSIQFGNIDLVKKHMAKVTSWVKPGGFIVMRTMRHVDFLYPHKASHYIWTEEDIYQVGKELGLDVAQGPFIESITSNEEMIEQSRTAWWYKKPGILTKYKINPYNCKMENR